MRHLLSRYLLPLALAVSTAVQAESPLAQAVAHEARTPENVLRDQYRNPEQTLNFFGITPEMHVVEIWPGLGWYSEILAPYLSEQGTYVAAGFNPESGVAFYRNFAAKLSAKYAAQPEVYGKLIQVPFEPPKVTRLGEPGSADAVLTFRNVHNWMPNNVESVFAAFYQVLKPGGTLGLVEHRRPESQPHDPKANSGYVHQDYVIQLAQEAGFELVASSELNANAKDDADHPRGVWTLPPSLRLGETDQEAYIAIGESDRMTLKFIKPASAN